MQPRNSQPQDSHYRNIPPNLTDPVDRLLFSMQPEPGPVNPDWAHPNYDDIQPPAQGLDDIMIEPDQDQQPNYNHQPAQPSSSAPLNLSQYTLRSVPSQPGSSVTHARDDFHHIAPTTTAPTTRSQSHVPHSNNFSDPHTPPSQRLPPRVPISRAQRSPVHTQHQHVVFSQSAFHHNLTSPSGAAPQSVTTSEPFSPGEQFQQSFALPQTIAGSYVTRQESTAPTTTAQYFTSAAQETLSPAMSYYSPQEAAPTPNVPTPIDHEKYVRQSAITAETVKVEYRDVLKKQQTARENAARNRGSPMTAKEKERERSRRESAVTRKRAEVYIKELEKVCRRLPWVEMRLQMVEIELQRIRRSAEDFDERSARSQKGHMPPTSMQQMVKREPSLHVSPASQRTSVVRNQMEQLDLRLQNTGESG